MIFTVGHRDSYETGLAEHGDGFLKMGKREAFNGAPYAGGAAFASSAEAESYLGSVGKAGVYAVYGLLADWAADTEQLPGEPHRRLIKDARIVSLETAA